MALPTVMAGWLFVGAVGLVISIAMYARVARQAKRTRMAGINGEVANIQNATRVRLALFIVASACGVIVSMRPSWQGIRGFGFVALAVIAWAAWAESHSSRRAQELAADRLMRDRLRDAQ